MKIFSNSAIWILIPVLWQLLAAHQKAALLRIGLCYALNIWIEKKVILWVYVSFYPFLKNIPSLFSLTGVKMCIAWQELGLKNHLQSSLSIFSFLLPILQNVISQTWCQPLLFFSQILPRDSQVSHQPIQHFIIKQGVKHREKKANRKEKCK